MPQFITRGDPLADVFRSNVDTAQWQRRQEEEARELERQRQKQLLRLGLGAAAGAGIGLLAAPALGLAGAPAGFAGDAALGMSVPTAATSGLLGTGGALSGAGALSAGLTGASLGANVAQGAYSGDIAGPLGLAAGVVNQGLQASEDRQVYGYSPSREERDSFARAAIKAGTSLGKLRQNALAGGGDVGSQLAQFQLESGNIEELDKLAAREKLPFTGSQLASIPEGQRAAAIMQYRDQEQQRQLQFNRQNAFGQKQAELDAATQQAIELGNMEMVLPPENIPRIQTAYNDLDRWQRDYQEGNIDDATYLGAMDSTTQEIQRLSQRKPRPKPQTIPRFDARGQQVGEMVPGIYEGADGITTAIEPTKDGYNIKWKSGEPVKKPVRIGLGGSNVFESMDDAGVLPDGRQWQRTSEGVKLDKPEQTPGQKLTTDIVGDLFKPDSTGAIPAIENPELLGQAVIVGDRLEMRPKLISLVEQAEKNAGAVTPNIVGELVRTAKYVYGDAWGQSEIGMKIGMLDAIAEQNVAQPGPVQAAPPGVTGPPASMAPPPGSAASVEAVRPSPPARALKSLEPVGKAIGIVKPSKEESASARQEAQSKRFEQIQRQNIEAGIDAPVIVIRADGSMVQVIKSSLTPERIAELKAAGFSIPGLEGD